MGILFCLLSLLFVLSVLQPNTIRFPDLAYCIANTVSTRKVAEIKC